MDPRHARTWTILLAAVLGSSAAVAAPAPAPAVAASGDDVAGFTRDEANRLRRGRTVRRPLADHERLVGGNTWVVVRQPWREVWRALSDLATYKHMFRGIDRIEVLRSEGQRRTVQIEESGTLFTLSYLLQMRFDERTRDVEFRLDPSTREHVRDGWGFLHLDPLPDGTTLLTYGAAIDPGNEMVRALFEDGLQDRLMEPPERLKRFIEREAQRRMRARAALQRTGRAGFPRVQTDRLADRAAAVRARLGMQAALPPPVTIVPPEGEAPAVPEPPPLSLDPLPRDADCDR